ncbi:Uncharacterized protein Rs2_21520 [Raphanus sativus]|nr:Uncharacterized protein Rs2_21520 [Raphanus sativus]
MIRKNGKKVIKIGHWRITRTAPIAKAKRRIPSRKRRIVNGKIVILHLDVFVFSRQLRRPLYRNTLREMLDRSKIYVTFRLKIGMNHLDRLPNPLTGKTDPPMITAPKRVSHLNNVPRPGMDHANVRKRIQNRSEHQNKLLRNGRSIESDVEEKLFPIVKIGNSSPNYQHHGTRSQSPGGRLPVVLYPQKSLKMVGSEG